MTIIQLLNHFQLIVDDQPVTAFRSDKARAMLAYVAAQGEQTHSRSALATLLWPELPEKSAKTYLRSVLSNLRKIAPDALTITRQSVTLNADVMVDAATVQEAIAQEDFATAVDAYAGEFLRGFTLGDALEFDDWVSLTRESLHITIMQTYDRLLERLVKDEAWERVITYAQQQLQLEAWHEPAYRALLQALMAQGLAQEARAQYERCREVMQEEFGAEPSEVTLELWRSLNRSEQRTRSDNLPQLLTPFFGRSRERTHLTKLINERTNRLITITGQGGSGKTRFALEIGHLQRGNFADGVWFVPLVGVNSADAIIPAIADTLNIRFVGESPLTEQLHNRLRDKEMLLILDNLEHLPEQVADIIADLLHATAGLTILATSRRRLQLRIETLIPLGGLSDDQAANELFTAQMQRLNPFVTPDGDVIGRICELVAGLPLGIELAAAQTDQRSLAEIADALQNSLSNTETALRDLPQRQRSLQAVFESSWVLLTEAQQRALAQLAIFRGSFGMAGVKAVCEGVSRRLMQGLVRHSLVQVAEGRYSLHEVVREFSAEKRVSSDIAKRHSDYYLQTAIDLIPQWDGLQFSRALEHARSRWDNLNAAWQFAVENQWLTPQIINAMRAQHQFRGLYHEAVTRFADAQACVTNPLLRGWLLAAQAYFLAHQIDTKGAFPLLAEALTIAESQADRKLQVDAQITQQIAFGNQSRYADCIALVEPIIEAANNDPLLIARAKFHGGYSKVRSGEIAEGRDMLLAAREICEREGNVLYQILAGRHLGMAQLFLGDLDSAEKTLIATRDLAQKRQDREREMFVYAVLGPVYLYKGDLSRASELFREQLAFAKQIGRKADIALNQANLSNTLMGMGRYDEAFNHINAALPIMEGVGDRANLGTAQCVLATTYYAKNEKEKAAEWMQRAIDVNTEIGARLNETGTRAALGDIYLGMDRPKLAHEKYAESERLAVEIGDKSRVAIAQIGMAQAALALSDATTARTKIEDVLRADDWKSAFNLHERAFNIYQILDALGDERAPDYLHNAHDILQTQAANISDDVSRQSFLHNVPIHKSILQAANNA